MVRKPTIILLQAVLTIIVLPVKFLSNSAMIRYIILGFFIFLSITCCAQQFTLELILNSRKVEAESSLINVEDTLFAFEDNTTNKVISPGVKLNYIHSQRISLSTGIEFFVDGATYIVINDDTCLFCPVQKGWGAFSYTFVLPQQINYRIYKNRNWSLYGIIGITPIVNFESKEPTVKTDNRYLSTGVADVMNALGTTIKPVYLDYNLGFKVKYRRANFYFHYQDNISSSIAKPLSVYGNAYPFTRRNSSYVFSLSYDLFRWGKVNSRQ